MDWDNLLNDTLEDFLYECVSDKIETVSELPEMLKEIGYLENKQELMDKITWCEVLDAENTSAEDGSVSENRIYFHYELDFILQTFIDSQFLWRVQGCAQFELSIPDSSRVDWTVFDAPNSNFSEQYEKHKELVIFHNIVYTEIECDTI